MPPRTTETKVKTLLLNAQTKRCAPSRWSGLEVMFAGELQNHLASCASRAVEQSCVLRVVPLAGFEVIIDGRF